MSRDGTKMAFHPGDVFNPYKMFVGIWIPDALARCRWLSAGAKLAYGRLARYAGREGKCYPSIAALARELGVCQRQAQRYLRELERARLISRSLGVGPQGGQTSNSYQFLWHEILDGVTVLSCPGGDGSVTHPPTRVSPKESQAEESYSLKREEENDLDYLLTNRKLRDPRAGERTGHPDSPCKQYPRVRDAVTEYMMDGPEDERVEAPDRIVFEIMAAAPGRSEEEVLECLRYLRNERGLRPGTKNGPRQFAWFPTVVTEYFLKKQEPVPRRR